MKWCVLIKPIGIKEPIGIYCDTGFDYFGESEAYIDHDFGIDGAKGYAFSFRECLKIANPIWEWRYEGGIDLIVPVFLAKIIFLKNTIKANKAFEEYLIRSNYV